jgi:flagellar basal body-associated protein FliL
MFPVWRSKPTSEVPLCEDMTVERWQSYYHRTVVQASITAKTELQKHEQLDALVKQHDKQIKDKIRSIIASAQPEQLQDPKLQFIKTQVKSSLQQIDDENLIREILVTKWQSYRP